jgi:hypothetical protein
LVEVSSLIKDDARQKHIQADRERLHGVSKERVKTWNNTMMGKRNQRMKNITQKEEEAEKRRVLIDKQWHEIRDREKLEALEKSRLMRLYQNPEVREMHSSLKLQNVVAERDLQLVKNQRNIQVYLYPFANFSG